MTFPNDLEKVDKDLFDRVWKIVQECGESERHFNQLQSIYRGVASTWLLATFAAVGYLLFNKDGSVSHPRAASAVCLAAAFGIFLIWILDLYVYHRLLVAVFREGHALEMHFPWLPQQRTNMHHIGRRARSPGRDPIRTWIAFYYVGTILGPLAACAVCWVIFLEANKDKGPSYLLLFVAMLLPLAVVGYFFKEATKDEV